MTVSSKYDIAIVGGGLVGASLACALAPLGYRIAMVERVPFRAATQPSYDDRTLALSYSSCKILEGLGLWSGISPCATPIREIIATELGRPGRVEMKASEMGLEAFGHVVEARAFGAVVLEKLEAIENVDILCPASVSSIETLDDKCILGLEGQASIDQETGGHKTDDQKIEARLVVAADGAASSVRQLLNIPVQERDYGQTAVICNITPEIGHRGRAFERLTPSGPFAVLPHVGERCGLVWSVPSEEADALMEMEDSLFLERAQERFGKELGAFNRVGKRSSYGLKLVRAEHDIDVRTLIMGNAAHTIHPVGAQGFNLGLRDVAVLAEVLASDSSDDPGSPDLLKTYSEWRQPDQEATVAWSDGMTRFFANPSPLMAVLRSAGMIAHALIPPLRRRLASAAMGYRGRVPRLALGEPLQKSTGEIDQNGRPESRDSLI